MTQASNTTASTLSKADIVKQLFLWGLIAIGLLHQIMMYTGYSERIYIFIPLFNSFDEPQYTYPIVSLEYQWWIVLLISSFVIAFSAYFQKFIRLPERLFYPLYIYILFLLVLVKPI